MSKDRTFHVPPDGSGTSHNNSMSWMFDEFEPKKKKGKRKKKKYKRQLYKMEEARKIKLKYDIIGDAVSAAIDLGAKWLESIISSRGSKDK